MLYIRVDMNDTIATGHVMRCLAIAEAARQQKEDTTFFLADEQAVDILKKWGYSYIVLNTDWNDMESELSIIERIIVEKKIECLLIDSYQVTSFYLKKLSEMTRTIYLDDKNSFSYPVDAIICYASYWKKFQYNEKYPDKKLLLGPKYAPLRREFSNCGKKKIKDKVENLLLLSGGTDNYDILDRLLEKIEKEKYKQIIVVCGTYYQKYECIYRKYRDYQNIEIYKAVNNMKYFMNKADMIITAGGTTLYEICAVGTPAISYSIADNQLDNVKQFYENGIIDYAGDVRKENIISNIVNYLELYHMNKDLREKRAQKMQRLIDGKGSQRIYDFWTKLRSQ